MEAIERLELTRGTAALQYGPQFGGLLNYVTKAPPLDRRASFASISSAGSYGLRSTYNSLAGTIGDWSYVAYASGRWSDGYRTNGSSTADAEYLAVHYAPLGKYFSVKGRVGHSRYLYRVPRAAHRRAIRRRPAPVDAQPQLLQPEHHRPLAGGRLG
ncbi:MAG: hypothetical protein IPN16_22925 [Gemmatimonadetes bacterium]|nr:hypothetical protein [Gemmatimonadota bacterium]